MNVGNAEILLNNPHVIVGDAASLATGDVGPGGIASPVAGAIVRARVQSGPVRVGLWVDAGPAAGACVFDGVMRFPDGAVRVSDIEGVWVFSVSIGHSREAEHGVKIYVDDPSAASRVDVLIDTDGPATRLTEVQGYALLPVRGIPAGGLPIADELGLILDGYDRPLARLAAAVKLILVARGLSDPERVTIVTGYRTRMIGEWLRGLRVPMSASDALALASLLDDWLAEKTVDDVDRCALELATALLRAGGIQILDPDPGRANVEDQC